jgi:hypothetical protein
MATKPYLVAEFTYKFANMYRNLQNSLSLFLSYHPGSGSSIKLSGSLSFSHSGTRFVMLCTDVCHRLEAEVAHLKSQVDAVNRQRKLQQTAAGAKLDDLEAQWLSLVSKNAQIEARIPSDWHTSRCCLYCLAEVQ